MQARLRISNYLIVIKMQNVRQTKEYLYGSRKPVFSATTRGPKEGVEIEETEEEENVIL